MSENIRENRDDEVFTQDYIKNICDRFSKYNYIDPRHYTNTNVKLGLRNIDGTGICAGFTLIGNVHGYVLDEGDKAPVPGKLTYRGYDVTKFVEACEQEDRYGFEEAAYLLLFGELPTRDQLDEFCTLLGKCRELPEFFTENMIIKTPSRDIMNKLARNVLSLYSYDDNPDDTSLENVMRQCLYLIARFPIMVAYAYQVKKYFFDRESLYIHFPEDNMSTAENILRTIRADNKFTKTEARLLDMSLILHAEHGGGNNSSFAARVLASSGTDVYSCIAAAVGSLKGHRHGGANLKVIKMLKDIMENVKDWKDEDEVASYLTKIINKEAGDRTGLIYGMGHAIYTESDPRAVLLKKHARELAVEKGILDAFELLDLIERLAPQAFFKVKGYDKPMCANVDLYSGFVYNSLDIPSELYTPLFAISRVVGWSAHIIEEHTLGNRLMRPAYKSVAKNRDYVPIGERG